MKMKHLSKETLNGLSNEALLDIIYSPFYKHETVKQANRILHGRGYYG